MDASAAKIMNWPTRLVTVTVPTTSIGSLSSTILTRPSRNVGDPHHELAPSGDTMVSLKPIDPRAYGKA
jgi:hypothetical protein